MLKPINNTFRQTLCLDGVWDFLAQSQDSEPSNENAAGFNSQYRLAVPGSWNEQVGELYHFFGYGWYQKEIFIPKSYEGQRVFLRIGSVNQDATVWLDGHLLGEHFGGHLPIDIELTAHAKPGQLQKLVIRVDARLRQRTLPSGQARREEDRLGFTNCKPDVPFDFFPYSGIHRSVTLYAIPQQRIKSVRVNAHYEGSEGIVSVLATVDGVSQEGLSLCCKVEEQSVSADVQDGIAKLELRIPDVRIWDIGKPELYNLILDLCAANSAIDQYSLDIGVRNVRCDETQFYLNDRPVWMTGFGKHEDFPVLGRGHCDALLVKDFDLLEWTHSNSFRTSHYPYDEAWYEYADRVGVLIVGETPFVSLAERLYDDELKQRACEVIKEMIERDANHPSVVLWSVANEPTFNGDADKGTQFFKAMADTARQADPTRPVGYVGHDTAEINAAAAHFDWIGVNKYFGWYISAGEIDLTLDDLRKSLQDFHDTYSIPVLLSEFGADSIPGCNNQVPLLFTENFQCEIVEKQYRVAAELPFVFGCHVWNFAEFATAQQLNRPIGNRKGAFTRERMPKMLAFTLRRLYSKSREQLLKEPPPEPQLAKGFK